jgi:RimJ/RimL family protein N-acetyltransferase
MNIQILKYEDVENFSDIPNEIFSDKDKNELLFAFENKNFVGSLKGSFITEKLFYILDVKILKKNFIEHVYSAFCNYLFSKFLFSGIEVLSWDKPEKEIINNYLEKSGFKIYKKKLFFEKSLENYDMPYDKPFNFKTLNEVGKNYFIEIMVKASIGDPFEDMASDPEKGFQELVDYAGEKFNPNWWKIAYLNNIPVGVILPQIFSYSIDEGTLFYLGIIPEFRGKGFGKIIHSIGLEFLKTKNVLKYKGSTDIENKPMINIFKMNNCIQTNSQLIFKAFEQSKIQE